MFTIETTVNWLCMVCIVFGIVSGPVFPSLLPVAPTALTPMRTIHEIAHTHLIPWFTSGFE